MARAQHSHRLLFVGYDDGCAIVDLLHEPGKGPPGCRHGDGALGDDSPHGFSSRSLLAALAAAMSL